MKKQKFFYAAILLIYLFIVYAIPPSTLDKPSSLVTRILKFPVYATQRLTRGLYHITRTSHYVQENKALRRSLDKLQNKQAAYVEIGAEIRRLRKLLKFKELTPFELIACRIITKDSSNITDTIQIDQGLNSGIDLDTAVIVEAGLVGRVIEAFDDSARVALITDANSRISAIVSRSRQLGVVYGTGGELCVLKYIPLEADLQVDDAVVTSGFSDIYPKGLLIGRIVKVAKEPDGLSQFAIIKPSANLVFMEEVLCIE